MLDRLTGALDLHTLHLRIVHQTLEIQACKDKIYSAPKTRGFVKGPSHVVLSALFRLQLMCMNIA